MLRIATFNVNGIRAAHRRGFAAWAEARDCDVIALQEVRAQVAALPEDAFGSYHVAYDVGTLPGRNGVALLTRIAPDAVRTWSLAHAPWVRAPGWSHAAQPAGPSPLLADTGPLARPLREFLHEGRYIEVDLADAPVTVASVYVPKGGLPAELQKPGRMREAPDDGAKHARKLRFLDGFAAQLGRSRRAAASRGREYVVMGDFNIAHNTVDVTNWRPAQKAEGFLPIERAWLDQVITPRTLVDVVRRRRGDVAGPYSWWSWSGEAFAKDVGWRIDYHLATPRLARAAVADATDKEATPDARISDHCPVVIDYDPGQL